MFVLDASVALVWGLPDEQNAYAERVLREVFHAQVLVPLLWNWEIVNGLLMAVKRNRIQLKDFLQSECLYKRLPLTFCDVDIDRDFLFELCRRENLTAYDGVYLCSAMQKNAPLASLDKKLQQAARNNGVMLFEQTQE
jgi:predicted nucleic acid-binding protein